MTPAAIKAVDQDVGINAPVRYTIQDRILSPFLDLNPETAEIVMIRSLQDHELTTSITIVIKVEILSLNLQFNQILDIIYKVIITIKHC